MIGSELAGVLDVAFPHPAGLAGFDIQNPRYRNLTVEKHWI